MDEKEELKSKKNKIREKNEKNNVGNFKLIYPCDDSEQLEKYK